MYCQLRGTVPVPDLIGRAPHIHLVYSIYKAGTLQSIATSLTLSKHCSLHVTQWKLQLPTVPCMYVHVY